MPDSGPSERLVARVGELIEKGGAVVSTHRPPSPGVFTRNTLERGAFAEWRAQALVLLTALLGENHVYTQRFTAEVTAPAASDVRAGMGILRAVAEDARLGVLTDYRSLVAAEVFADFLGMAGHLRRAGYHVPAATLAGAVLEDGLRRLAASHGVPIRPRDDAAALNSKLAEQNVYTRLDQKRLHTAIEVRNLADHGHFGQVGPDDVTEMLTTIESFLARHLGPASD